MANNDSELWAGFSSGIFDDDPNDIKLDETIPGNKVGSYVSANRQILNILFLVDVSGSMRGQRIGEVNYAMESIFRELNRRDDPNSVIKVGIMEFSEQAQWVTPQPVLLENFVFTKIEAKPWITCYANAFNALGEKLSRKAFMDPNLGEYFAPVILFITDGEPTDFDKYPAALKKLQNNGWFRKSAKYAIAVGEEARTTEIGNLLTGFTGVRENVRFADEGEALVDLIQYIALRASEVQTSLVSDTGGSTSSIFNQVDQKYSSMFNSSY